MSTSFYAALEKQLKRQEALRAETEKYKKEGPKYKKKPAPKKVEAPPKKSFLESISLPKASNYKSKATTPTSKSETFSKLFQQAASKSKVAPKPKASSSGRPGVTTRPQIPALTNKDIRKLELDRSPHINLTKKLIPGLVDDSRLSTLYKRYPELKDSNAPIPTTGVGQTMSQVGSKLFADLPTIGAAYLTGGQSAVAGATSRFATPASRLAQSLGKQALSTMQKETARGLGAGSVYGAIEATSKGMEPREALDNILMNTALFGAGDPAAIKGTQLLAKGLKGTKGFLTGADIDTSLHPTFKLPETEPIIPSEIAKTQKRITLPIEDRDFQNVGSKKIKAYQTEHPELKLPIQTEARRLLGELGDTVKGEKFFTDTEAGRVVTGTKRGTSDSIARIIDETGATYKQVRDTLDNIAKGEGKENTALAKKIELVIDDNLTYGTKAIDDLPIEPDANYINLKEKLTGTKQSPTKARELTDKEFDEIFASPQRLVPPKQTEKTLNTISRKEIIKKLDKEFAPIRVGRFREKAFGIFKNKAEVIRTKLANDIPTISHEVGHYLDKKLNLADPVFDKELFNLGMNTSRVGYAPKRVRNEGVAEFMRLYLTEPDTAMAQAPNYYAAFEKKLTPEIKDTLLTTRSDIHTWYNQPEEAKILGLMSIGEKGSRKMTLDSLYTMVVDEIHPIKRFVEKVGAKGIPIEKDPYKLAWLARGWSGRAQTHIHKGFLDASGNKIGKSLNEILEPMGNNLDRFRAYIAAKHSLELRAVGKQTAITEKGALVTIKNAPSNFQQSLDDLSQYQSNLLNELIDAGVVSAKGAKKMREMYPNYVPFYSDKAGMDGIASYLSKDGYANLKNPIKKVVDSNSDIIDPLESIIKNTYLYTNLAERNKVGRAMADLADNTEGIGRLIEKVDSKASRMDNVLSVFRNGKQEFYQLDPELYQATLALDKESAGLLTKILTPPASWLRAGAVLSPDFMIRNPIRDTMTAFVNSKYGFLPVVDNIRGLAHALKKDDMYWRWMNDGGAMATLVSLDRNYLQKNMRELLKKGPKDKAKALVSPKTYLDILRGISELSEISTRLGEYGKGIKSGANPFDVAIASRDVTLDFGRIGSKTKAANKTIAFFNAAIQGTDRLVREFKQHPVRASLRTALSVTLPSAYLYFANRNDPRYQELPQWQKDMFWIIPTKDTLIRIPKPFELGVLFGTMTERMLEFMDSEDPKAFDGIGKTIFETGAPSFIPTGLLPILEVATNHSLFTDRPIIPRREENLSPEYQYSPYTTEIAKLAAKAGKHVPLVNDKLASPRNVEHLLRGTTGGLGLYTAQLLNYPINALGSEKEPSKPAPTIADRPFIKAITATPYRSPQSVEDFYNELKEFETKNSTGNHTGEKISNKEKTRLKKLRQTGKALSDLRKDARDIQNSKHLTPVEKRQKLDALDLKVLNTVRKTQKKSPVK